MRACLDGFNKQIFGADEQVPGRWPSDKEVFGPTRKTQSGRAEFRRLIRSADLPWPAMAGAFSVQGKSVFLTFAYGVMYVLSFATIITVFATAIALAVLLVMIACRSIWRLFR
jgi:hypothetical protein